ncbi:MAG TPA: DUF4332 domain-containing protein [Candidatus Thermoplasmatota archaeon]|nr:DUF4332 domain-containing protein [Candidatus Thermoplasmatota archaeon]
MANGKRITGTILFVVALAAVAWFMLLLYADSLNDRSLPGVPLTGEFPPAAIITGVILGVIVLLLGLLLIIRSWDGRQAAAEGAEAFFIPESDRMGMAGANKSAFDDAFSGGTSFAAGPDIDAYNLAGVPLMGRAWEAYDRKAKAQSYFFPRSVESGLYTNDYIVIDNKGTRLKLMTLLGGPKDAERSEFPSEHRIKPRIPGSTTTTTTTTTTTRMPSASSPAPWPAAPEGIELGQRGGTVLMAAQEAAKPEIYYGYAGDVHQVEDIEGIGVVYGEKLRDLSIETTARLCYEDAGRLADKLGIARKTVEQWQSMSEFVKVKGIGPQFAEALARAGVAGIAELKRRSASGIADQVNGYLDELEVNVVGQKVTAKRVEAWQDAAKGMKRVRMQVPEK